MMATILTLIIMGILFQGVMAVVDSVLETVNVNAMLKSIPVLGTNLNLVWAYLFVMISQVNDGGGLLGYGVSTELLSLQRFGMDLATAIVILAFIPIKDTAISALGKGIGGRA